MVDLRRVAVVVFAAIVHTSRQGRSSPFTVNLLLRVCVAVLTGIAIGILGFHTNLSIEGGSIIRSTVVGLIFGVVALLGLSKRAARAEATRTDPSTVP